MPQREASCHFWALRPPSVAVVVRNEEYDPRRTTYRTNQTPTLLLRDDSSPTLRLLRMRERIRQTCISADDDGCQ